MDFYGLRQLAQKLCLKAQIGLLLLGWDVSMAIRNFACQKHLEFSFPFSSILWRSF